MLIVWMVFSLATFFVVYKATRRRLQVYTPRLVYRWFLFVYQVTYFLGIVGYLILLLVFTGVGFLLPFNPDSIVEVSRTIITLPNSIICGSHQMAIM